MRPATSNLSSLLASTRQLVFWEEFEFTLTTGEVVTYSTKDPDAVLGVVVPEPAPPPAELWVEDTFTGSIETTLATHVGEIGATWSGFGGINVPSNFELDGAGNVVFSPSSSGTIKASGLPSTDSANYYFRTSAVLANIPTVGTETAQLSLEEFDIETGWGISLFANSGDTTLSASAFYFGVDDGGTTGNVDTGIAPSSSHVTMYVTFTEGRTAMKFYVNDVQIGSTITITALPADPEALLMRISNGVGASKVRVGPIEGGYL